MLLDQQVPFRSVYGSIKNISEVIFTLKVEMFMESELDGVLPSEPCAYRFVQIGSTMKN